MESPAPPYAPMSLKPYISPAEMAIFEEDGALIVDLQLTPELLAAAEAAHDRDLSPMWADPAYVALIASPVFEEIAKQVLKSDKVYILETGRASKRNDDTAATEKALKNEWPEKHGFATEWANAMHTDVQVTTEDFEATPRREHLAIWFWVNDVPAERAAMRVLKGSHKRLGAHWQEMQRRWRENPDAPLPVSHGPRWEAEGEPDATWFSGEEPTAMAADRGFGQVFSQSLLVSPPTT